MQQPNFPNEVFLVQVHPGKQDCGHPKARITKIPARFTNKSAVTMNGRRLKLEQFGKFNTFARSTKIHIVTGYTRTREDAMKLSEAIVDYIKGEARRDLDNIQNILLGIRFKPLYEELEYVD